MRKLFKLDNRGVTLVELIVTVAIASFVLVAIATFLVHTFRYNAMVQDEVYVQDQVRYAMKGITNLAMEKQNVAVIPSSPYTVIFNRGKTDELTFKLIDSGKLMYNDGSGDKVLAKDIALFVVDAINPKLVNVTIKGKKNKAEFEVTDKIYLRN